MSAQPGDLNLAIGKGRFMITEEIGLDDGVKVLQQLGVITE